MKKLINLVTLSSFKAKIVLPCTSSLRFYHRGKPYSQQISSAVGHKQVGLQVFSLFVTYFCLSLYLVIKQHQCSSPPFQFLYGLHLTAPHSFPASFFASFLRDWRLCSPRFLPPQWHPAVKELLILRPKISFNLSFHNLICTFNIIEVVRRWHLFFQITSFFSYIHLHCTFIFNLIFSIYAVSSSLASKILTLLTSPSICHSE